MAFVQTPPNSTGEKIDVRQLSDGLGNSVDRQVINIGDPSTFGQVATVTSSNALKVDNSGVTQPVSGTVTANQGTAAAASGSWPVEVTDGTNVLGVSAHPVRTDPTGTTTQPISGTVTANIGTSGSLALDASVTGLQVAQGSTTSGQKGDLVQGAVTTNAPAYTTAQTSPLSLDTSGLLRVSVKDTPQNATAFKVDGSGVTQPVSGTITANIGTSGSLALDASVTGLQVAQGSTTSGQKGELQQGAVTTNAPSYTTAQTSPLSLDTAGLLRVSLKDTPQNTNAFKVDGSGVTQPVSGTITVQPGNTANTTPWLVQDVAQSTGGMSFFSASVTSTKQQVKGSAGTVYGITAVNNGSTLAYIQVFNKLSANVTVGTTAPDYVVPVPAPSSGTAGAGIREEYAKGLNFGTGVTVACTTTRTGSTTATCDVNVNYI